LIKKKLNIVILVGGKGKRLGQITKNIPKPLVKIQDSVFLDYLLDYIQKKIKNINKIYFIAGYLGNMIKSKYKKINNDKFKFLIERKIEGTGRAIFKFKKYFQKYDTIILNGDTLFKINFKKFINFSYKSKNRLIIALTNNKTYKSNSKLANLNLANDKIYISKKKNLMNGGIYFVKKNYLKNLRYKMKSFEDDFISKLIDRGKISGVKLSGKFIDIGTPKNLKYAKKKFLKLN